MGPSPGLALFTASECGDIDASCYSSAFEPGEFLAEARRRASAAGIVLETLALEGIRDGRTHDVGALVLVQPGLAFFEAGEAFREALPALVGKAALLREGAPHLAAFLGLGGPDGARRHAMGSLRGYHGRPPIPGLGVRCDGVCHVETGRGGDGPGAAFGFSTDAWRAIVAFVRRSIPSPPARSA